VKLTAHDLAMPSGPRRYVLVQPTGHTTDSLPVVIDLHGSGSRPYEHIVITDARRFAAAGALVVVPEAAIAFRLLEGWPAGRAWNVPGTPLPGESIPRQEPDDVAFLGSLADRLIVQHGADPARIHVRGYSGGARLAAHAAVRMADRLASLCCVAGVRFPGSALAQDLPPLLAIHGELDIINPYHGGAGPRWSEPVPEAVGRWALSAGCHPAPRVSAPTATVRELRYTRPDGSTPVRLTTIADAAHSWPGSVDSSHHAQFGAAGTFSASRAHWDFLREIETARTGPQRTPPQGGQHP
jgi:polyhydroxybutyrate depolymerase